MQKKSSNPVEPGQALALPGLKIINRRDMPERKPDVIQPVQQAVPAECFYLKRNGGRAVNGEGLGR